MTATASPMSPSASAPIVATAMRKFSSNTRPFNTPRRALQSTSQPAMKYGRSRNSRRYRPSGIRYEQAKRAAARTSRMTAVFSPPPW